MLAWLFILILVVKTAPPMVEVSKDGEFDFLPYESASLAAQRAFQEAFPPDPVAELEGDDPTSAEGAEGNNTDNKATKSSGSAKNSQADPLGSSIVIVLQREDLREGLTAEDRAFVTDHLEPGLRLIQSQTGESYALTPFTGIPVPIPVGKRIIRGVWTFNDSRIGPLLDSKDGHATLVLVELSTEFLNRGNRLVLSRIQDLLASKSLRTQMPAGLDVALSGSATVGQDMKVAEAESAAQTEHYTKVLVIVLLLAIYRAPLMVLIPLITVGVAVNITIYLLRILAKFEIVGLFVGLDVYVSVVVYGAGVDFCLFLIARYKEELDHGANFRDATMLAVKHVGAALATSAGTSIVGIAMLTLTEFGKFRQAGVAISFGLFVALICAMTLTPAMMYLFGRWTFWPDVRRERISASEGFMPARSVWSVMQEQRWLERGWEWIAELISRRPGGVFVTTILLLTPLALVGAYFKDHLSYGLLTDLRPNVTSVRGADAVRKHFPRGVAGPTTFLIQDENLGVSDITTGRKLAKFLTDELQSQSASLAIADVRSQTAPHGAMTKAQAIGRGSAVARNAAHRAYCSTEKGPLQGQLMRIDIVFHTDPFARDAITRLDQAEIAIREALHQYSLPNSVDAEADTDEESSAASSNTQPENARVDFSQSAKILAMGATASIRDLKRTTDRDQIRINIYVSLAVFLVLMTLLRQPALCAYLILTVIYSYLVTLGAAWILFRFTNGPEFSGLDWKVPVYLFTLLLALGEDYNVLFMSRVTEEQPKHGAIPGILIALTKTGGIISSCGIIMAGTFASLMTGSLASMVQMGFALAFGVMIDTFIVRPILVPAYLVLLNNGTFGSMSQLLGAYRPKANAPAVSEGAIAKNELVQPGGRPT